MASEAKRACGYRKVGGIYLVSGGIGVPCDRLPFALGICPCCSHGIKQSRGWTWLDVNQLVGGPHDQECNDAIGCPLCKAPSNMGKAGLLWVGEKFYKTPDEFMHEAERMGISRRLSTVPRDFKLGETWVLFAHPKTITCSNCFGSGLVPIADAGSEKVGCGVCDGGGKMPAIFHVLRPSKLEIIITESQSKDAKFMEGITKRKLSPVVVPDDDKDHQGTVFDKEEEAETVAK